MEYEHLLNILRQNLDLTDEDNRLMLADVEEIDRRAKDPASSRYQLEKWILRL